MIKYFKDHSKWEFRALQVWQILVSMAHNRQITTYKRLAAMIGYRGALPTRDILARIAYYCNQNKLPPLTALVVNTGTGQPGGGIPVEDAPSEREDVFDYDWFGIFPPTPDQFRQAMQDEMG
jgi:hypothetical protein